MTMRWAGAALAAVMACAGLGASAERAEAASLPLMFSAFGTAVVTSAEGIAAQYGYGVGQKISFSLGTSMASPNDTTISNGVLLIQFQSGDPFGGTVVGGGVGAASYSANSADIGVYTEVDGGLFGGDGDNTISAGGVGPLFTDSSGGIHYSSFGGSIDVVGYGLDLSSEQDIWSTGSFKAEITNFVFYPGNLASVLPVPLPASAPLFGAALLGLAGIGYGMKRRSLPQAA